MMIYFACLLSIGQVPFSIINVDGIKEAKSLYNLRSLSVSKVSVDEVYKETALGCDEVIYLSDPFIVPAYYQALTQIIAEGTLLNGSTVFRAGEEIILSDGFEIMVGATLDLDIGPCIF